MNTNTNEHQNKQTEKTRRKKKKTSLKQNCLKITMGYYFIRFGKNWSKLVQIGPNVSKIDNFGSRWSNLVQRDRSK